MLQAHWLFLHTTEETIRELVNFKMDVQGCKGGENDFERSVNDVSWKVWLKRMS